VEDTGTGMTEYVQRRIFDPFFTTKEPGKGTGLGLATVQRIVQETGGAISVSSTVGEGSRFHLYFPRITTPTPQQGTSDESSANLQGSETVLLVEDDDAVRRFTRTVLDGHGYRVLEAADANAAIALAGRSSQAIHLLLTDVILPGMNGEELAKQLQTSRPDIKVLYLSGYAWDVIGPRIGQDIAFLPKPFSPDALATKIRKVLGDDARMNRRSATT
jgi:CheY-like chemotaxis protein